MAEEEGWICPLMSRPRQGVLVIVRCKGGECALFNDHDDVCAIYSISSQLDLIRAELGKAIQDVAYQIRARK